MNNSMIPVTTQEYLTALDIIKRYRRQKGRKPIIEFLNDNKNVMTIRLYNVLQWATYGGYQFIDELDERTFFMLKNSGNRSWSEFQDLLNK